MPWLLNNAIVCMNSAFHKALEAIVRKEASLLENKKFAVKSAALKDLEFLDDGIW